MALAVQLKSSHGQQFHIAKQLRVAQLVVARVGMKRRARIERIGHRHNLVQHHGMPILPHEQTAALPLHGEVGVAQPQTVDVGTQRAGKVTFDKTFHLGVQQLGAVDSEVETCRDTHEVHRRRSVEVVAVGVGHYRLGIEEHHLFFARHILPRVEKEVRIDEAVPRKAIGNCLFPGKARAVVLCPNSRKTAAHQGSSYKDKLVCFHQFNISKINSTMLFGSGSLGIVGHGHDDTQCHTEESGKEHLHIAGQKEGDGVGREPEKRNGLLEDEVPLRIPIEMSDNVTHIQLVEQTAHRAAMREDVRIGDFVQRHHDGGEDTVHRHTDAKGNTYLAPAEVAGKDGLHRTNHLGTVGDKTAYGTQHKGNATLEDNHRHVDAHAEETPHYHTRQHAEAGLAVAAFAKAQAYHLAHRAEDGELEEAHNKGIVARELFEGVKEAGSRDKKRR